MLAEEQERSAEQRERFRRDFQELKRNAFLLGLAAAVAAFFFGRSIGSGSTEEKLWDYATRRAEAVYVTGACNGALFRGLDPLPNEEEFLGDFRHELAHRDHVAEVLKRFGVGEFAEVPSDAEWGPEGPPHPAQWACAASRRFLPTDLAVSLDQLEKWIDEERPGGVLWDQETGLTGQRPVPGIP